MFGHWEWFPQYGSSVRRCNSLQLSNGHFATPLEYVINLINLLCILLFWLFFDQSEWLFERCNVVSIR